MAAGTIHGVGPSSSGYISSCTSAAVSPSGPEMWKVKTHCPGRSSGTRRSKWLTPIWTGRGWMGPMDAFAGPRARRVKSVEMGTRWASPCPLAAAMACTRTVKVTSPVLGCGGQTLTETSYPSWSWL